MKSFDEEIADLEEIRGRIHPFSDGWYTIGRLISEMKRLKESIVAEERARILALCEKYGLDMSSGKYDGEELIAKSVTIDFLRDTCQLDPRKLVHSVKR